MVAVGFSITSRPTFYVIRCYVILSCQITTTCLLLATLYTVYTVYTATACGIGFRALIPVLVDQPRSRPVIDS